MSTVKQAVVAALAVLSLAASVPASSHESMPGASPTERHGELIRFMLEAPEDSGQFADRHIAVVAGDGASAFEVEAFRDFFMDRGAHVHLLAPRPAAAPSGAGVSQAALSQQLIWMLDFFGEPRPHLITHYVDEVRARDYDAVFVANGLTAQYALVSDAHIGRFLRDAGDAHLKVVAIGAAERRLAASPQVSPASQPSADDAKDWAFDLPEAARSLASALAACPSTHAN
jgi:putative intracellular protease/amidase